MEVIRNAFIVRSIRIKKDAKDRKHAYGLNRACAVQIMSDTENPTGINLQKRVRVCIVL